MLQGTGINIFKDTVKDDPTLPFRGVIAVGFPDLHNLAAAITGQPPDVNVDISILTAYRNALRRVATVLKAKTEDAKEELKEEGTFVLVATFRWIRYWPGYHKLVVMRWDEEAKGTRLLEVNVDTDDDDEPEEEIAAPPAPAPPTILRSKRLGGPRGSSGPPPPPQRSGLKLKLPPPPPPPPLPRPQAQAASVPVRPPRPVLFHAFGLAPWRCVQR
eukprot:g23499.t1